MAKTETVFKMDTGSPAGVTIEVGANVAATLRPPSAVTPDKPRSGEEPGSMAKPVAVFEMDPGSPAGVTE